MLFTRLQKECRNLLNCLLKFDVHKQFDSYISLSVFTFEDVTNICSISKLVLDNEHVSMPKKLKIEIQTIISNLIDLNQQVLKTK